MKKVQGAKGIIIALVLILLVVGYYYYLSNYHKQDKEEEVTISEAHDLLLRDLKRNYPPSPKEVIKYFFEITTCLYSDKLPEEDVNALALKIMELCDDELIANNPQDEYLNELKSEITSFQAGNGIILNYSTSSSVDVDYFEENGDSFARIYGTYYMQVNKNLKSLEEVFILRKDDAGHWKMYGWEPLSGQETVQ